MGLTKIAIGAIIATASVIGTAVSAKKEKESQMLSMEEKDREHRRNMEEKRYSDELKEREYEKKLANAPQKPIYRFVNTPCPRCVGLRITNIDEGTITCPYCDFVEHLPVDHYEIDIDSFNQQLQEEENKQKQAENEKRKKQLKQNSEIAFWITVALFVLFSVGSFDKGDNSAGFITLFIAIGIVAIKYKEDIKEFIQKTRSQ